jgi:hypothetical protein
MRANSLPAKIKEIPQKILLSRSKLCSPDLSHKTLDSVRSLDCSVSAFNLVASQA